MDASIPRSLWRDCFAQPPRAEGKGSVSYARTLPRPLGLGTIDEWQFPTLHSFTPSEVFVLRLTTTGLPLLQPSDALQLIRAAGRDQNIGLDVRGVALSQTPGQDPASWMVDLIYTTPVSLNPLPFTDDGATIAAKIQADPGVKGAFPSFAVTNQIFGNLTDPADAIDHWRSQPILWDHLLGTGPGGPTDTFASPAQFSIVKGQAEDGARATPWVVSKLPLTNGNSPPSTSVWWVVGGIAAAALGVYYVTKGKKR